MYPWQHHVSVLDRNALSVIVLWGNHVYDISWSLDVWRVTYVQDNFYFFLIVLNKTQITPVVRLSRKLQVASLFL